MLSTVKLTNVNTLKHLDLINASFSDPIIKETKNSLIMNNKQKCISASLCKLSSTEKKAEEIILRNTMSSQLKCILAMTGIDSSCKKANGRKKLTLCHRGDCILINKNYSVSIN